MFGLCWILFFRHRDIQAWPGVDPKTGVITASLTFKPGAAFYSAQFIEKERVFKEIQKETQAGPYVESIVAGVLGGNNLNHIVGTAAMMGDDFGVLIQERNGEQRLLGNLDAGCKFTWDYTSGETDLSRKRSCQWLFESAFPVPIYQGTAIVIDNKVIPVGGQSAGGGSSAGTGNFQLLTRFDVGQTAPMNNGDTTFTHADLQDKNVLVFSDGIKITELPPNVTAPTKRTVSKLYNDTTLTINGGAVEGETIEIFIY